MSIIKHVTLQKIVAHDFRYIPSYIQPQRRTGSSLNIISLERRARTKTTEAAYIKFYDERIGCS